MQPQVDFYVLEQGELSARSDFICRLSAKIVGRGLRVTILTESESQIDALDQHLWHVPPESFIPHGTDGEADEAVILKCADSAPDPSTVCINLRRDPPNNHAQLSRLVEIVCQEPGVLAATREKYRFYRQLNYPLQSHPISATAN